jgi:hypothetical protein
LCDVSIAAHLLLNIASLICGQSAKLPEKRSSTFRGFMSLEINRAALFGCWLHFSLRGLLYRLRSSFGSLCARSSHCKPGPRSLKAASQPDELTGYCFKAFDVAILSPGKMTRKTTFDLPHDLLRTPNMKQMKET